MKPYILAVLFLLAAPALARAGAMVVYEEGSGRIIERGWGDVKRYENQPGIKIVPANDPKVADLGRDTDSVYVSSVTGKIEPRPAQELQREKKLSQIDQDIRELVRLHSILLAIQTIPATAKTDPDFVAAVQKTGDEATAKINAIRGKYEGK